MVTSTGVKLALWLPAALRRGPNHPSDLVGATGFEPVALACKTQSNRRWTSQDLVSCANG